MRTRPSPRRSRRRWPSSGRSAPSSSPSRAPLLEHAGTIQQAEQFPEATELHLEWLRTRLADYGADVRARLLVGLFVSPDVREAGKRAREAACDEIRRVFEQVDLLAAPTMPVLPPRIGSETVWLGGRETPYRLALIPYNSPWSLVGSPVASVPCGFVEGLPVGLALVGPRLGEATVLAGGPRLPAGHGLARAPAGACRASS